MGCSFCAGKTPLSVGCDESYGIEARLLPTGELTMRGYEGSFPGKRWYVCFEKIWISYCPMCGEPLDDAQDEESVGGTIRS